MEKSRWEVWVKNGKGKKYLTHGREDTKTFADVGYLLTKSVSSRLPKDSVSILFNTRHEAKNNIATFPYNASTHNATGS